jgi:hypothetical protein
MPDNGNGSRLLGWIGKVPTVLWTVLLTQVTALAIWAIRLDQRVGRNEATIAETIKNDTEPGKLLAHKVQLMEDRQRYLINYVLFLREELVRTAPPNRPVPPFLPPGGTDTTTVPQDRK